MKKCIVLQGLPASGKSTLVRQMLEEEPGIYKVINKDSLRAMFDNGVYTSKNERFILRARDLLILLALEEGYIPVVDDTNAPHHIARLRTLLDGCAPIEIISLLDVPKEVCIERDKARPNPVGEEAILRLWEQMQSS